MIERLRILPVLIVAATVLFGFKVGGVWRGVSGIQISEAQAQTAPDKESAGAGKAEAAKTATAPKSAAASAAKTAATSAGTTPVSEKKNFTGAELQVLQSLAKRRQELDRRAAEQSTRENVLVAAERRIEEKIAALKKLEVRIKGLLKQHDDESEAQLKSLVKVYETMKPKEAARILEELEMPILIEMTERMREQKMAPILAKMNPAKAKELTVELATRRPLPETGG